MLVVGKYIWRHWDIFLLVACSSEATSRFAMIVEKPGARQDWANKPNLTSLKHAAWVKEMIAMNKIQMMRIPGRARSSPTR